MVSIRFGYDQKGRLHCSLCGKIVRESREKFHEHQHELGLIRKRRRRT